MKLFYGIILIITLISQSLIAGNEVGGGGIAENNVIYSYMNLEKFIDLCLVSATICDLNPSEVTLLSQIRAAMPDERKTQNQIVFKSESANPGFFIVDGQIRIAKTGFDVGDFVYFNTDLMYPPQHNSNNSNTSTSHPNPGGHQAVPGAISVIPPTRRPLDIPIATSILIHEFGRHHGQEDATILDVLGTKVQTLMRSYANEVDGGPDRRYLLATAFQFGEELESDLVLRDNSQALSVGSIVRQTLVCANGAVTKGFALWNLHWLAETDLGTEIKIPLRARVKLYCEDALNKVQTRELDVMVYVKKQTDKTVQLSPNEITMSQIDCAVSPGLCH